MILAPTRWTCPNCTSELVRSVSKPLLHPCRGLNGIIAPMVPGIRAKVTAVEREDYLGDERTGRIMSVVTEREDGRDTIVFAPRVEVRR